MQGRTIRIGTRGSPLALWQAGHVRDRLMAAHGLSAADVEITVIKTSGDQIQDRPLSEVGGKGLFTKEIEEALIAGTVDLAVHSMKDVATALPDGLVIGAVLPREDVRDAFISPRYGALADMPAGAKVGTSSLRRQAQVKALRPDLEVVQFRGNVETRLKKLADGVADATFLACAGLNRLGLADRITRRVEVEEMLPAVAQGAVGIEIRGDDQDARRWIAPLDCPATSLCVMAERTFLATLEGSCRTPIGGLARLAGDRLVLDGQILTPDGTRNYLTRREGAASSAIAIGAAAGEELLERAGGTAFFADVAERSW
ncbi:MAG: hydroxymethylbilane synthase [Hyphomicrobiaceae bacterium]|nr:hydroxymethylbilane synthase [Hyphomicrobiaceae bacterium]